MKPVTRTSILPSFSTPRCSRNALVSAVWISEVASVRLWPDSSFSDTLMQSLPRRVQIFTSGRLSAPRL